MAPRAPKIVTRLPLVLASALLLTTACADDPPPRKKKARTTATPPSVPTEPKGVPEETPEVAYVYSPVGKRDPFRSFFDDFKEREAEEAVTELQTFELGQLKVVAIVTGRATPFAMVEDPTGKGHTITRGTLVGKNWGRVSSITRDAVLVKEEYQDYTGRKIATTTPLNLPRPEELKLD